MNIIMCRTSIILAAMLLAGCAGKTPLEPVTQLKKNILRGEVRESFREPVTDPAVLRYLATVKLDSLPPEDALEVSILREMVTDNERSPCAILDSLWDHEPLLRDIVKHPESKQTFLYPAAELYYLFSASGDAGWRMEAARKLYSRLLVRVRPEELSGYALHFFCLALLENGKFDEAMPFMERLRSFTTPRVFQKDMVKALAYASRNGAYTSAEKFLVRICRFSAVSPDLEMPDREIGHCLKLLENRGKLGSQVKARLRGACVNASVETGRAYAFFKLLRDDAIHTEKVHPVGQAMPSRQTAAHSSAPSPQVHVHGLVPVSTSGHGRLNIRIQIIRASNREEYSDPRLSETADDLKKIIRYSSFRLEREENLSLEPGGKGKALIRAGSVVEIIHKGIHSGISRINVRVVEGKKEVLKTKIESVSGGTIVLGCRRQKDSALLLRIITEFSGTGAQNGEGEKVSAQVQKQEFAAHVTQGMQYKI